MSGLGFAGRVGLERQRMDGAGKLRRQQRIYHTMTVDPALPFERLRYDIDSKMRFTAGPVAGVALMQMGLVHDVEAFRNESFVQLICDRVSDRHDPRNIVTYLYSSMARTGEPKIGTLICVSRLEAFSKASS
jgi:hypothetical protein